MEVGPLAEIVGHDYSYVHRIVKNGRIPDTDVLEAIMDALEMTEDERKKARVEAGAESEPSGALPRESPAAPEGTPEHYRDRILIALEKNGLNLQNAEALVDGLLPAIRLVVSQWAKSDAAVLAQYVPSHGPEHNCRMIEQLCQKATAPLKVLEDNEIRILLYAIWLHDIGLCELTLPSDEPERLKVLENYQTRSVKYLDAKHLSMQLSGDDKQVVGTLCRHHRNIDHLSQLATPGWLERGRQQGLIALLRLAMLFEVSHDRVKGGRLLPFTKQLPPDLESELLRNLFVYNIAADENTLCAELYYLGDPPESVLKVLNQRIQHDLQGALHLIKHVLVTELEHDLLLVATKPTGVPVQRELQKQVQEALKLLSTSRSPNASRVMETLLAALDDYLIDAVNDPDDALDRIRGEMAAYGRLRFYQAHVLNIRDELNAVLEQPGMDAAGRLDAVRCVVQKFRDRADAGISAIRRVVPRLFSQKSRFFVFGFSNCVLEALKALNPAVRAGSEIVVFECRAKSHHGIDGSLEYSDGVEFARKIREQFEENMNIKDFRSVTLIFDGAAAAAMGAPVPTLKSYLLLGAEGIYLDGSVASTIGTMPIVLSAHAPRGQTNDAPQVEVYVLADGNKVRGDIPQAGVRDNLWLTGEKDTLEALAGSYIELGNLVNEKVPAKYIRGIITEADERPLAPAEIREKYPEVREPAATAAAAGAGTDGR
jgi:translation initiation factor 2B subunit (eIF-2B alpha/beta/delta family)